MRSIIAIALAIVLGIASLGLSQPDTLANAVSFLLDLINVQSEQIDQVRIENAEQHNQIEELYAIFFDDVLPRLSTLEVQTPSN